MKKVMVLIIIALMAAWGVSEADAWNLDIVPVGSLDATGNSSIFFNIVFNSDVGGNVLDNYAFNIFYDTSELTWNSIQTTVSPPSPLFPQFGLPTQSPAGSINMFNGATFSSGANINGSVTLANVAFNIHTPVGNGSPDVWFDTVTLPGQEAFTVDNVLTNMNTVKIGGSNTDVFATTVVPEPVSSALFIVGGAVMGVRRYWKKR